MAVLLGNLGAWLPELTRLATYALLALTIAYTCLTWALAVMEFFREDCAPASRAVHPQDHGLRVVLDRGKLCVSWGGVTEMQQWTLQSSAGGDDPAGMGTAGWKEVSTQQRNGFQTSFDLPPEPRAFVYRVLASDPEKRLYSHSNEVMSAEIAKLNFPLDFFGLMAPLFFVLLSASLLALRKKLRICLRYWALPARIVSTSTAQRDDLLEDRLDSVELDEV